MFCLTDPRDSALVFFYILPLARPRVIIVIVIQRGRGRIGGGGEGTRGRRCGCLAAILGRPLGVVTVEVVVVVSAPARRRAVRGRIGAVVTGRVLVDVTGGGRLVVVVTWRVRVDVTGRVWVAVVKGCILVAGAVPVPATGGRLKRFTGSSTLTR